MQFMKTDLPKKNSKSSGERILQEQKFKNLVSTSMTKPNTSAREKGSFSEKVQDKLKE